MKIVYTSSWNYANKEISTSWSRSNANVRSTFRKNKFDFLRETSVRQLCICTNKISYIEILKRLIFFSRKITRSSLVISGSQKLFQIRQNYRRLGLGHRCIYRQKWSSISRMILKLIFGPLGACCMILRHCIRRLKAKIWLRWDTILSISIQGGSQTNIHRNLDNSSYNFYPKIQKDDRIFQKCWINFHRKLFSSKKLKSWNSSKKNLSGRLNFRSSKNKRRKS